MTMHLYEQGNVEVSNQNWDDESLRWDSHVRSSTGYKMPLSFRELKILLHPQGRAKFYEQFRFWDAFEVAALFGGEKS